MTDCINPLVSIITPTYNRADYIENTIKSVLEQSYNNIEYIIVDGCSTDSTVDLLDKYKHQDARLDYISENDYGMYDAINKGFKLAKGEILAYINSDDLYTPGVLNEVVNYFNKHPEIDVVYGDTLVIHSNMKTVHINMYMPKPENWLRAGGIIAQPTVFMRRACWDNIGNLKKDVQYLGDCEYWLRLINHGYRLGKINEILAIELNHENTLRNTMKQKIDDEKIYLRNKYWPDYFMSENLRALLLFSRKLLTPAWHIYFILKVNFGLKNGSWSNFINNYNPKANLGYYIVNKLFKCNHDVWRINIPQ